MMAWGSLPLRARASKAAVQSIRIVRLRMFVEYIGDPHSACDTHGRTGQLTVSQGRLDGAVEAVVA